MERIDLQKLHDLPIEDVARRLGLNVVRHKALCPFHDDRHPSLSFFPASNTFKCFVCNTRGDVIDLAMRVLDKGFLDTCRWLADAHNVLVHEWKPLVRQNRTGRFDADRYMPFFQHPVLNEAAGRFLYQERRIDPRVARWCRLSSWTDRQGISWLQIPYFDLNGRLVGLQARNLDYRTVCCEGGRPAAPRFRFPEGSRCHLYNLPVLALLAPGEPLYLTEGCSDCWAMLSSGHKAIAIPSATLLKEDELEVLRGRELHIYPDNDEAGEKLYRQLASAANRIGACLVRHPLPPSIKDFGQYWASLLPTSVSPQSDEPCI